MDNYPDNIADILSNTMSIDDFISSIIDNVSSEEFNIVYVYLKGLANIDYYSINLDTNKLYVEKLTEYAIKTNQDLLQSFHKISYYYGFLSDDERVRLLWNLENFDGFSCCLITKSLCEGLSYDIEKLPEYESVFLSSDRQEVSFDPIAALINLFVIFKSNVLEQEGNYFRPYLHKIVRLIEGDETEKLENLLNIYRIETLSDHFFIDTIIDNSYHYRSTKVIEMIEKKYAKSFKLQYVKYSSIYHCIQTNDFDFALNTINRLYPLESIHNFPLAAINLEEQDFLHFVGSEVLDERYILAFWDMNTVEENLNNFEILLQRKIIDLNQILIGRNFSLFVVILEQGSKDLIQLCLKYGGSLYNYIESTDHSRKLIQYARVLHNPNRESIDYVLNEVVRDIEEGIEDIINVIALTNNVEMITSLLSQYPQGTNALFKYKDMILKNTIEDDHFEMFCFLVENYYGFNVITRVGYLIHLVIRLKNDRFLDYLVTSPKTDIRSKPPKGDRPIIYAITRDYPYAVKLLHQNGVKIEDSEGLIRIRCPYINKKKHPELYQLVKSISPKYSALKDNLEIISGIVIIIIILYLYFQYIRNM